jgi:hypothetical protein
MYQINIGRTYCDAGTCAAGSYFSSARNLAQVCTQCAAGQSQLRSGKFLCDDCDYGQYQAEVGKSECVLCAAGTAQGAKKQTASATCVLCVKGKHAPASGARQCDDCGFGRYADRVGFNVSCTLCGPGTAHASTAQESVASCVQCLEGTYAVLSGTDACTPCAGASFQNTQGQTSCKPSTCTAGKYRQSTASQAEVCDPCAAGTFQAAAAQTSCPQCGAGTYVLGRYELY